MTYKQYNYIDKLFHSIIILKKGLVKLNRDDIKNKLLKLDNETKQKLIYLGKMHKWYHHNTDILAFMENTNQVDSNTYSDIIGANCDFEKEIKKVLKELDKSQILNSLFE